MTRLIWSVIDKAIDAYQGPIIEKQRKAVVNLHEGRETAWKRKNATATKLQKCIDSYKEEPEVGFRTGTRNGKFFRRMRKCSKRTAIIRKIINECGVGRSWVYELEEVRLITFPADARKKAKRML